MHIVVIPLSGYQKLMSVNIILKFIACVVNTIFLLSNLNICCTAEWWWDCAASCSAPQFNIRKSFHKPSPLFWCTLHYLHVSEIRCVMVPESCFRGKIFFYLFSLGPCWKHSYTTSSIRHVYFHFLNEISSQKHQ